MEETTKRVLAGFCLGPPIAFLFYFLPPKWLFLFLCLVASVAIFEVIMMAEVRDRYTVLFLSMISLLPLYQKSLRVYLLWLLFSPVVYMFSKLMKGAGLRTEYMNSDILRGVEVMHLSGIFVILPMFYLYLLKEIGNELPLILLIALWASDTGAYYVGKTFGRRPLVPSISPKKTYEGLLGAVMGSTLIIVLASKVADFGIFESLILGSFIGLLGQMGDIFESVGKRICHVKDSSSLIPGHGGILDRMDSFIFTAPFLYHYLTGIKVITGISI